MDWETNVIGWVERYVELLAGRSYGGQVVTRDEGSEEASLRELHCRAQALKAKQPISLAFLPDV